MIYKVIGLFLLASVKFAFSIPIVVYQFSNVDAFLIIVTGGGFGILFFCFLWKYIIEWWAGSVQIFKKKSLDTLKVNKKKRWLIWFKNTYGYWGMVVFTPVVFSIPLGTFIIQRYFRYKSRKLLHLFLSVLFWAFILIGFFNIFKF